jgi:hypothetical protein
MSSRLGTGISIGSPFAGWVRWVLGWLGRIGSWFSSMATDSTDRPIPALADAWQRFDWAEADGYTFEALSKSLGDTGTYGIWVERHGDRWQATFRRLVNPDMEAKRLSEIARPLGSYLDNMRAALNYATYQLAQLALIQDPSLNGVLNPDAVEFPIFMDRDDFRQKNRVKKLPDEMRQAVEEIQPYDGQHMGLVALHELAREYRHRVIHPIAVLPVEERYHVLVNGIEHPVSDVEIIPHERLKDGDILLRFSLPDVNPDADVKPQIVLTVGIDHPMTSDAIGTSVLNRITPEVGATLSMLDQVFFK